MKHGMISLSPAMINNEYQKLLDEGTKNRVATRIMKRDSSVFSSDKQLRKLITNRLGWVDITTSMKRQIPVVERFGNDVLKAGIKHVVLIGMGGSSLCPEVFKLIHGKHSKLKSFDVLDSTDPIAIRDLERNLDLKKTLFIVASKSGGTVETRSHESYFLEKLSKVGISKPGHHFAAITDKGSSLEAFARQNKYRKIFINPSDIGGRYSALSFFGLVPGFFAGVKLREFINSALEMEKILKERNEESNPALAIASLLVASWKTGKDKLTLIASPKCSPFVPWIEQLVAESTGKQGKGIIPIDNEPLMNFESYTSDRIFCFLRMADEKGRSLSNLKKSVQSQNIPFIDIILESPNDIGQHFLIWETATAIAGYFMEINPFDEPNVTESKENTTKILAGFQLIKGQNPKIKAIKNGLLSVLALDETTPHDYRLEHSLEAILKQFLSDIRSPNYLATLCYFKSDKRTEKELATLRSLIGKNIKVATIRGYGPRFLHSIGQLYKGGAPHGRFIVFVRGKYPHLRIPGQTFDFGQLITAQALGDTQALSRRKLPVLFISIDGPSAKGLKSFNELLLSILQPKIREENNV